MYKPLIYSLSIFIMTTEQTLPITAMLEEEMERYHINYFDPEDSVPQAMVYNSYADILPQVHTLEEASRKKAKEEERERIVGILEDWRR